MNKKDLLFKWSTQLYISWVLFIALLTLLPGGSFPGISWDFLEIDKLVHIVVFGVLTFLGGLSFSKKHGGFNWKAIGLSFLLACFYGTILELTQSFVPDRSFDYADLTANYAGGVLGLVAYRIFL